MNKGLFIGRVAKSPVLRNGGKKPVCFFTLLRNEYAGVDKDSGEVREDRKVAIPFTVFGERAKAIAEHVKVGDQLAVEYHLNNDNREVEGEMQYGFDFIVDNFEFGSPGELKRAELAQRS